MNGLSSLRAHKCNFKVYRPIWHTKIDLWAYGAFNSYAYIYAFSKIIFFERKKKNDNKYPLYTTRMFIITIRNTDPSL